MASSSIVDSRIRTQMDPLHDSAYSSDGGLRYEEDDVPVEMMLGRYRDRYAQSFEEGSKKSYFYYSEANRVMNEEKDGSDESSDDSSDDEAAPQRQIDDNHSLKRTEIVEADRVVLPSLLTSDQKLDWTLRYVKLSQELRQKAPYPLTARKILKLAALERDFLQTARIYAKIIIDEKFLPDDKKTIKPADMGGIAGGLKYFKEGILFKFALDSHGIYGGDINAMKSAGHEMKNIASLYKRVKPDYFVPIVGVVDYKGFRIMAISLLPIKGSTLIYGSNDGGRTFNSSDPVVNKDMSELGESMKLQAHKVSNGTYIRTPADLEVHKGTDGRYYLVDVARLWPPEPPSKAKGSFLYRLLREEFVTTCKKPLSSDAFSGFGASDPSSKEYNLEVVEAFKLYIKQLIPAVAQELHKTPGTDLEKFLHSRGINFRHMGLLWQHLPSFSPWRRVVMSEIVTRAAKSVLRSLMRRSIERFGVHNNEPFLRLIASFFNLLLGTSEDSTAYWQNELFRTVRDSFFYIKAGEEFSADNITLRDEVDDQTVFAKLLRDFGVQLKESFWKTFSLQLSFAQPTFMEDTDIEFVIPVTKRSDLGQFALAIHLLEKTESKVKNEETLKVLKRALTILLDKSLVDDAKIFVAFRYTCRALIGLPIEVTIASLPLLRDMTKRIWALLETSEDDYKHNLTYFVQDLGIFFMHTYCNPPKTSYTPETTSLFIEMFNPYFIAISCTKKKELLKRAVLSEDLFAEIEELDFTATNRLWPELIVNTLKKIKNLKVVTMSHALLTPEIMTHLNNNKLLEKVVVPDLSRYVNMNHLKEFFQAHPHLKDIVLDEPRAAPILSVVTHKDLESFECMNSVLAADLKPGELDPNALAWLNERKNLKKLRVKPGLSMTGDSTAKLASVIPQIEELSILSAEQGCVVEPLEPILALKNLTHLAMPRNIFEQQQLTLTGPLKLKQLNLKHVMNCSPKVLATIIKSCPDLEILNVSKSVFYDECFLALAGCPKLEVLRAKQTFFTAEALKAIAKCKNLRQLAIGWTSGERDPKVKSPSNEENFAHLTPILPNLEMLDLSLYQQLTNRCVNAILTSCKKLQKLKLPPMIGDQAFDVKTHSSKHTLTHLDIFGSAVTDVGMSIIINNYPNIKVLQSPSNITVNTFKRLPRWTHLQRVVVRETTQNSVGIPNLQLGLNVWSLMLNTATESKTVLVEYASPDPKNKKLIFVGCLGGVRLNMEANIDLVTKILQLTPA